MRFVKTFELFLAAANAGSISKAAKGSHTRSQTFGKQLKFLLEDIEPALGGELFHHHARGLTLTKRGEYFRDFAEDVLKSFNKIKDREIADTFKVEMSDGIGSKIITHLKPFLSRVPLKEILLNTLDDRGGVKTGKADVTITSKRCHDPDFVEEFLFSSQKRIYASRQYLRSHPRPQSLDDLKDHVLLVSVGAENDIKDINIHSQIKEKPKKMVLMSNELVLREGILNGVGIGFLASHLTLKYRNTLVDVFPDNPGYEISYYCFYPKRLRGSSKIDEFLKLLKKKSKSWETPQKKQRLLKRV